MERNARWVGLVWLAVAGCGPSSLVVTMNSDNNSGQSGTATFTQLGGALQLEIDLTPSNDQGAQAAHIHEGRCGEIGPVMGIAPKSKGSLALLPVELGKSVTQMPDVQLSELMGGTFAINVHYSRDVSLYVSCGNIP